LSERNILLLIPSAFARKGSFVLILLLYSVATASGQDAPPCGQSLNPSPYRGVPTYSNGPDQWKTTSCDPYKKLPPYGTYGSQFQCTEYVKRFYSSALGVETASSWTGDAVDYFASANAALPLQGANNKMLLPLANGGFNPPLPNDILVFNDPNNNEGHVAIVTEVAATEVTFSEQNWSVTGTSSLTLSTPCTSTGCTFTISNRLSYPKDSPKIPVVFSVAGWMREPSPAIPITIDFEQFTGPSTFTGIQPSLTVGNATFYGGQILTNETNSIADESSVYATASPYCPGCLPAISIAFAQPVSNFSLFVINGNTVTVTYTVSDDQGGFQTKTLSSTVLAGAGTVSLTDTDIHSVAITSGPAPGGCCGWDFAIDNVTFTPVPIP